MKRVIISVERSLRKVRTLLIFAPHWIRLIADWTKEPSNVKSAPDYTHKLERISSDFFPLSHEISRFYLPEWFFLQYVFSLFNNFIYFFLFQVSFVKPRSQA